MGFTKPKSNQRNSTRWGWGVGCPHRLRRIPIALRGPASISSPILRASLGTLLEDLAQLGPLLGRQLARVPTRRWRPVLIAADDARRCAPTASLYRPSSRGSRATG